MNSLNELFFNSSQAEGMTYDQILADVQQYCTTNHADTLSSEGNQEQAKALLQEFIKQYVIKCNYRVDDLALDDLCERLYEDMAGCSFLKNWIYQKGVEEVNINAYDDIEVIMSGGRSMKIPDKFQSPCLLYTSRKWSLPGRVSHHADKRVILQHADPFRHQGRVDLQGGEDVTDGGRGVKQAVRHPYRQHGGGGIGIDDNGLLFTGSKDFC